MGVGQSPAFAIAKCRFRSRSPWHVVFEKFLEEVALVLLLTHQSGADTPPVVSFDLGKLRRVLGHLVIVGPAPVPLVKFLALR